MLHKTSPLHLSLTQLTLPEAVADIVHLPQSEPCVCGSIPEPGPQIDHNLPVATCLPGLGCAVTAGGNEHWSNHLTSQSKERIKHLADCKESLNIKN